MLRFSDLNVHSKKVHVHKLFLKIRKIKRKQRKEKVNGEKYVSVV